MAAARNTNVPELLDSLCDNVAINARVELHLGTNVTPMIAAINANTSLQEAELLFDTSFAGHAQHELVGLVQALCSRQNLQQLTLKPSSEEQLAFYTLSLSLIGTALDTASGLRSICLGNIQLSGTSEEFASLEESILNQTSLQELSCTSWLSEKTRLTTAASVDPLLRAFACSRSLKSLCVQPTLFGGDVSSVTAGLLCTMPRLQSLNLSKCNISDESMVAMATALRTNSVLRELRLTCRLEGPGCIAVAQCLSQNNTLELLCIHNTYINIHADTASIEVVETKSGPTGDESDESDETIVDDDHYIPIAQALQLSNRSLRNLVLHGTRLCKISQDAFVEAMKDNYSLNEVDLLGMSGSSKAKIDMYALLNRCGRQRLMQSGGTKRSQWVDVMAQVARDLDCLFYLISTKPSLCDVDKPETEITVETKRGLEKEVHDPSVKRPRLS